MISQDTAMKVVAKDERIIVDPFTDSKTPYRFHLVQHKQISIIALILWDQTNEKGGRTITNTAEQVLHDAIAICPKIPNMVVYKDQTGRWNRIYCLPDSKSRLRFVSIAPIRKGTPALWEDCLIFNICVEVYQQEQ